MDRLEAMQVFASVATLGSFAQAARTLRRSPSQVTRTIAQLEDHLGQTLLERTTRSVRLTEPGRAYLASCRRLLDDLAAAEDQVRDAEPRGLLRISAPIVFGRLHVLPIASALLAAHPALRIQLALSDRNVHLVEDGFDAAVRIGALADSSLYAVKLRTVAWVMLASPAYLARRGTPRTLAALGDHDTVELAGIPWPVRVEPRLIVDTADAALAAAEAGAGITRALSYQAAAALAAGRLVAVLERFAPAALPVHLVYPKRRTPSASVTALVAAARAAFK